MGDLETLAKARRELQDLYLGVPDDSVNLSFQELAEVTQRKAAAFSSQLSQNKKSSPVSETTSKIDKPPSLTKFPSLDFSRALEASTHNLNPNYKISHHLDHPLHDDSMPRGSSSLHHHHHHRHVQYVHASGEAHADHAINGHVGHNHIPYGHAGEAHRDDHHAINGHVGHHHQHHQHHASPYDIGAGHHIAVDRSMGYIDDDMSHMSGMTMTSMSMTTSYQGRRRRPGIPHSNICTVCSTYIYIFRYRCLVCGRVYCRQCVRIGMGEMAEGRKCVKCLGRRLSPRYIHKAGQMGCCMGYPSTARQQELKWAEKGPSRSGENGPGRSGMVPSSRSPVVPSQRTPTRLHTPSTPPSFVMQSPRSPYTPTRHHPLPF